MDDNYFGNFGAVPSETNSTDNADGTNNTDRTDNTDETYETYENGNPDSRFEDFTAANTVGSVPPHYGGYSETYGTAEKRQQNSVHYTGEGYSPYPNMNGMRRKKEKKPPTRGTLVAFGIITLVLCLVMSTVSGAISSFITVQVLENSGGSESTTAQKSDELISVPTETDGNDSGELPVSVTQPYSDVTETPTESVTRQNTETEKTKGEVYAESVNSIVGITCKGTKEVSTFFGRTASASFTSTGSGFFITSDGYIVTNYHVIENASEITVTTYSGQAYEATVRGYESSNDIAVIKVNGEFTPVKEGDSSSLEVGDEILVIGNALGELSYTFTDGLVSYLNRAVTTESGDIINMYQTNAAINEGNSGGPVYDMYGRTVGIASAKYEASYVEGLGFFIPLNDVKSMISDIIENGYVSGKPSLGVSVQPVTQTMSMRYSVPVGLYIVAVGADTAAANAGLKAADVITGIDGETVTGAAELSSALSSKRAGDSITVTVSRSGKTLSFALTLDEYKPADPRTEYSGVYDY